ncbi:anti-sigma factor family protein [Pseudomonas vancouverensis]|uniref:Transcriptional regulator n=1 Tax=Pseudomonas vancouverensis TaxID=95300 RepID=A0A1H2NC31_PSEVA|nr:transcriptional regulator [Pseudomonas vancouverensis]KAB0494164.1 transcriptional regulator [Pseudomonas vancouverensis]TDB60472.1 transcriptional regulator [Pseudomonas vancouverensis]SDV03017.1 Transmembrane transcriptional regulator (anti-sigma factor RsiW) [Pseudomonas vancouverensis]
MNAKPSDEQLVAYLDNQLDQEQRERIDAAIAADPMIGLRLQWLNRSSLPFKSAYDELTKQAPVHRLQAMLDTLPPPARPGLNRRWFLAAAAGLVAASVLADRLFLNWQLSQEKENWRGLVAEYMSLYVPQTLDHLPGDDATQRAQLRTIDARLGLSLAPAKLALPRAELKRAQILEYEGVPIAQITYLDPVHGPMALCVTRSNSGSRHIAQEQRHELNIVYWADMEHAWMLIGHNPMDDLQDMATVLRGRLNT